MPLNLRSNKCARFSLICRFDEKIFKKSAFLKDTKAKNLSLNRGWSYGSDNPKVSEHAHLSVVLDGNESVAHITYHTGKTDSPDVREPYLDDFPEWFGSFFREPRLQVDLSAAFRFDKTYEPVLQLNYPVLVSSSLFEEDQIVGHHIEIRNSSAGVQSIFLSSLEGKTFLVMSGEAKIELTTSQLKATLKGFSAYSKALVRKISDNA